MPFTQTLKNILEAHGEAAFEQPVRLKAILSDMAQNAPRERFLARVFAESGAFLSLKNAGAEYPITRSRILSQLTGEYCLNRDAAIWITDRFAEVFCYAPEADAPLEYGEPEPAEAPKILLKPHSTVAVGASHAAAVLADNTVQACGRDEYAQCDGTKGWRNVISVAAGNAHTVGLCADGTVLACGRNEFDQCDVTPLSNIAAVYAFGDDTYCVAQDGTVYAAGKSRLDLSRFDNIRAICKHPEGIYGIRHDGSVILGATTYVADWDERAWALGLTDVAHIISTHIQGSLVLKEDGRIYKMGQPDNYFATLHGITQMADLTDGFAVLRADGTVRVLPYDRNAPRIVTAADSWRDIEFISARYKRLVGLTREGRLLYACTDPAWEKRNGAWGFLSGWYPVLQHG
jgi:hypothetical protein